MVQIIFCNIQKSELINFKAFEWIIILRKNKLDVIIAKTTKAFISVLSILKEDQGKKNSSLVEKENNGQTTEQTTQSHWSRFFQTMASILLLLSR